MGERLEIAEVRAAWLHQPGEETPVDMKHFKAQRAGQLFFTTRSEIIGSIGAALFFAGVMAWRFAPERHRLVQFGCVGVIVWAVVTAFRFRDSIRGQSSQPD